MKKILIADDEEILRKIYSDRLTFEGYLVETAADGQEAIDKIASVSPDLILLDILMPKVSGLQVLEFLAANPKLKTIPVIVLSNVANDENIKKALSLGARDYLLKTNFSPNEIISKIKELTDATVLRTYRISPRDSYGDVIKLSQDYPFLNFYKCPHCGANVVFELRADSTSPDSHQFVARAVCDSCQTRL
ncbi:MAG TPA: response regulator [Candidatus Nanoarchaeia archaeon]|nr:regulator of RpoS [uncultured archaeon]